MYIFFIELSMADNFLIKFQQILAKCQKNENSGCLEYTGRISPSQRYPKMKITHLSRPYTLNMHVFMYKVSKGITPYRPLPPSQEISHLCHNTHCLNTEHLNMESRRINSIRKNCKRHGVCSGHTGHPDCILF